MNETTDLVSPCVGVCTLDPASGLCRGCFRNLDEIAAWQGLSLADKRALLDRLQERRAAAGLPVRRATRRRRRPKTTS